MSSNGKLENMDQRVISAALNLFAYEGYHAVSVPRIAEVANVGIGTIYRVTTSKSALAKRVFDHAIEDFNASVLLLSGTSDTLTGEAFFWTHWKQLTQWIQASPECFRFLILYALAGPGRNQIKLEDISSLQSIFEVARENDWLFTDDFGLLTHLVLGPLALQVLNAETDRPLNEEAFRFAGEAILRALAPAA